MSVLWVDPGKANGWSLWSDAGILLEHGILQVDEMFELLTRWPPSWQVPRVVGYEDYTLDYRAGKQVGSKLEASQVIGALKLFARGVGAVAIPQQTEARDMGYLHAQLKKVGRHADSHDRDAVAHGWYWFETQHVDPQIGEHHHLRTERLDTGVVRAVH